MREYEIMYIVKPHLTEEETNSVVSGVESWITKTKGEVLSKEVLGLRDVATEFKGFTQGVYVIFRFLGNQVVLDDLTRRLNTSDFIIRNLIVTAESVTEKKAAEVTQ